MLREAEARLSQGEKIGKMCRVVCISEQSYYRWHREYGGLQIDQAKRLKELGVNSRPSGRRTVASAAEGKAAETTL